MEARPPLDASQFRYETLQLHAGQVPDPATGSRAVPIYATTSYVFDDAAHGARLFALQQFGNIYTRIMNPTTDVFEKRVAALEGGVAALATSSGQSAQFLALQTLARSGDNIVSSSFLYGGTYNQFKVAFPRFGIDVRFAEGDDAASIEALIDDRTKAIYVEAIGNPRFNVPDFEAIAAVAKKHGVALVVDNTFGAAGFLCRPLDHGADIVVESATKWIGGHGTTVGGVIVDGGRVQLGQRALSGVHDALGRLPRPQLLGRLRRGQPARPAEPRLHPPRPRRGPARPRPEPEPVRLVPAAPGPGDAQPARRALRARTRSRSPAGSRSRTASRGSRTPASTATRTTPTPRSTSATASAPSSRSASKADSRAVERFVESVQLASHVANVGDGKTLVIHPTSTTHQQLDAEAQIAAGVSRDLVRVSVGIEHIDDIKADFAQAIAAAVGVAA